MTELLILIMIALAVTCLKQVLDIALSVELLKKRRDVLQQGSSVVDPSLFVDGLF